MKLTLTSVGKQILQEKINSKVIEAKELLEEMQIARESSSSNEDNPDLSILTNRYESVLTEKSKLIQSLATATVVDVTNLPTEKVIFGVVVQLMDLDNDNTVEYRIVSPIESDIGRGMISYESPIGRAMIGCRVGDSFDFDVRGVTREFEVLSIEAREI